MNVALMIDDWCRVCVWMHCYGSSPQSASPESFMPLHELIVRCLFTVQFKLAVRWVTPGWPLADISAFCTFLQGSSRHRLSLSQISQALTAAVRWLHYVPIWLVFAMTHLLTPTSLFRPPTTIDSSDKTDGDDDKWTLRGRWYGCIQMSAHSPVTVKHVWRCHPALSHGCTALLWQWLQHLNAVRTVMRVSLSQTCNYCIMLYSCQNRLQRARKTPWGAKLQT